MSRCEPRSQADIIALRRWSRSSGHGAEGGTPGDEGWHGVTVHEGMPLLGFGLPVSGSWATPSFMLRIAHRAEELGYASLWTFQRLLYPSEGELDPSFDAIHNPGARRPVDPSYRAVHDPLLPLAYVAGHTERIRLGTATMCAPFTPPALLAKSMTTLDHLSGGRLTVGLGIGWLPQEYAAAGIPFERRGARMEEYLRCLFACWTQDPVEFDGAFYTAPALTSARGRSRSPIPRFCWGARRPQRCVGPGGSPRAGSAAAVRIWTASPTPSSWCAKGHARQDATPPRSKSSCGHL